MTRGPAHEIAPWQCRRRLERQLHDGAALRLSAVVLRLGLLRQSVPPERADLGERIGELQDELHAVLEELREVAGRIYPSLLDRAGLGPALREVADQLATPVEITVSGERFGAAAEGAVYFAVAEYLASLPAGTRAVDVVVRREHDELLLSVSGAGTISARIPCE